MIITKHVLKDCLAKAAVDINIGYTDKELMRNIKVLYLRYGMGVISFANALDEGIVNFILLAANQEDA